MEIVFWVCHGVAIVSHKVGKAIGRVAEATRGDIS